MEKILISACLIGQPVRYDGTAKPVRNTWVKRWHRQGRLIPFCPEVAGGFAIPRLPAEIEPDADALAVLQGHGRVLDVEGNDVTHGFVAGAKATLSAAQTAGCSHAILMNGSPSCGMGFIYSGHFDGERRGGIGVTTALLQDYGIRVWPQNRIEALAAHLGAL